MTERTCDVKAIADTRPATGRLAQSAMIAATIPFAVIAPPLAGIVLGAMLLLRWDLRQEWSWWRLVVCGLFLPYVYIVAAIAFLALGGTGPRHRLAVQNERR